MRSAKILLVENDAQVAGDVSQQLEALGYRVCGSTDNGLDAIALAGMHRPDLVLMAIVIQGDMDGIEAAKHIGKGGQIPVVFLATGDDKATVERVAQSAPYGYLTQPFQARELQAAIEIALYKAAATRQLRDSERWFSAMLRCVDDGVIATDAAGCIQFINPIAEGLLGWHLAEVKGQSATTLLVLTDRHTGASIESPSARALRTDAAVDPEFGILVTTKDGRQLPIDESAVPIRDDRGRLLGVVIAFREVSERLRAEEDLIQNERRFRNTFDHAPTSMAVLGLDNRFLQVNAATCALLQRQEPELIGKEQASLSAAEDHRQELNCQRLLLTERELAVQFDKRYLRPDGSEVWVQINASLLNQHGKPSFYLYQVQDLTERKQAEQQLSKLAHYDPLTGLANRTRLLEETAQQILSAKRLQHRLAVVFMDLDHFKQVNDRLGHEAGDHLLAVVAQRLQACIRETDCAARLGGDEFVLLLPGLHTADELNLIADKIIAAITQTVRVGDQEVSVGISLGAAIYPDDGQDAKTLMSCADAALYQAKTNGGGVIRFYRPDWSPP